MTVTFGVIVTGIQALASWYNLRRARKRLLLIIEFNEIFKFSIKLSQLTQLTNLEFAAQLQLVEVVVPDIMPFVSCPTIP
jgi:hypothetical protein